MLAPALLAFFVASLFTALELVTSRYPQTYNFILISPRKCWTFHVNVFIYGAVAFGATLAINSLIAAKIVQIQGLGLGNPWVQAVVVGLTAKAFLHIRLFEAQVGSQSLPIGGETLVQIFEPWMLDKLALQEWNRVRSFVVPRANKYPCIADVRQRIMENIPPSLGEDESKALERDVEQLERVVVIMERYLKRVGKQSFDRVFPI